MNAQKNNPMASAPKSPGVICEVPVMTIQECQLWYMPKKYIVHLQRSHTALSGPLSVEWSLEFGGMIGCV